MKYNFKILRLLFLILFLIFNSCAVENFEENERSVDAGIKTRIVNFNEFKNNSKASNLINSLLTNQGTSNGTLNRIIQDPIRNFSFDTNDGLYLEYVNLHTYTFPIKRPVDNGKLENLVISLQNDGTYKVKLYVYNLTSQEKIDLELNKLNRIQNPVTSINIENFDTSFITESCEEITETIWVSCGSGNHNSSNLEDWHLCKSETKPRIYARTKIKCIIDGGGSGGGGGNSGGPPAGGSGGEPSEEPNFPTAQTPPEDYVLGISQPVKPKPVMQPVEIKTPCGELNKLNANNSIQQSLRILKGHSSGEEERGNYINESTNSVGANYLSFPVIPSNPLKPSELDIAAGLSAGNVKGAMHCHTNPETTGMIPMFSAADFGNLFNIAYFHQPVNNATKNYSEYTVLLSVGSGHYALKLKDFDGNYAYLNATFPDFKKKLENECKKIGALATGEQQIKTFLKNMKNFFGNTVGLFKASEATNANGESSITSWSEQTLNDAGTVVPVDCQ